MTDEVHVIVKKYSIIMSHFIQVSEKKSLSFGLSELLRSMCFNVYCLIKTICNLKVFTATPFHNTPPMFLVILLTFKSSDTHLSVSHLVRFWNSIFTYKHSMFHLYHFHFLGFHTFQLFSHEEGDIFFAL